MKPEPIYAEAIAPDKVALKKQFMFKHPVNELDELFDQLISEHDKLKKQLHSLLVQAKAIGADERIRNWYSTLTELRKEVDVFMDALDEHSDWEEETIFPLVSLHSGQPMNIFYVIEQEHKFAKQYIQDFLDEMDIVQEHIGSVQAHELSSCLLQALLILNEHFRKEEELIIPFTEKMLLDMEKFFS